MDDVPSDYAHPHWQEKDRVHNWRNYASEKLVAIWETFNNEQKQAIAETLNSMASNEEWD